MQVDALSSSGDRRHSLPQGRVQTMHVATPLSPLRRRRKEPRTTSLSPRRKIQRSDAKWTACVSTATPKKMMDRDEMLCPICFDLLCFPITLPCGHNFDRGCLLTAWEHEHQSHSNATEHTQAAAPHHHHSCPLCRQRMAAIRPDQLHVNLLLKTLITHQFPLEVQALVCDDKCRAAASLDTAPPPGGHRQQQQRHTWRTAASFFYVWLASVTEPPGFVLAVLLLMSLLAIALTPQQMLTNPTTLPSVFEGMDHFLNGFVLLVREISLHLDQIEDLWPWMQVFSFIL